MLARWPPGDRTPRPASLARQLAGAPRSGRPHDHPRPGGLALVGDALDPPFPDLTFGRILTGHFYGHLPPSERVTFLAEAQRVASELIVIDSALRPAVGPEQWQERLREAGADAYNHNLNTSAENYADICSTHTFDDRIQTVTAAQRAGLSPCSGAIFGMGESDADVVEVALALRELDPDSVPINFLIPFQGTPLGGHWELTPHRCLRILALFRFVFPNVEVRLAGGREIHLRGLQPLALHLANSMFLGDYLTSEGQAGNEDRAMIADAGFVIEGATEQTLPDARHELVTIRRRGAGRPTRERLTSAGTGQGRRPHRPSCRRSTGNTPLPHGPHFREPDSRSRTTGPHNCPVKVRRPTPVHSHWQRTARQWSDRSGPDAVGIEVEQQRHPRRPRAVREQLSEAGGGTGADTRPVSLQVAGQQQQPAGLVDLVVERQRVGFVEHPTHHPVRAAGRRSARGGVAQTGGVDIGRVFSADDQHL